MNALLIVLMVFCAMISVLFAWLADKVGDHLAPTIRYAITKKGRMPKPRSRSLWVAVGVLLAIAMISGAMVVIIPLVYGSGVPSGSPTDPSTGVATKTNTSVPATTPAFDRALPPGEDIRAGCISVSHWVPYGGAQQSSIEPTRPVTAVPQTSCWYLYDWGISIEDSKLRFAGPDAINPGRYVISVPVSDNSVVSFTLTIESFASSDEVVFGIGPDPSKPEVEGVLWCFTKLTDLWMNLEQFRGGQSDTLFIDKLYSSMPLSYTLRLEVTDARLVVYSDGEALNAPTTVVYPEMWFWIGYEADRFGGDVEVSVSDLEIKVR